MKDWTLILALACERLGVLGLARAERLSGIALQSKSARARRMAVRSVGERKRPHAPSLPLRNALEDPDERVRYLAAHYLADTNDPRAMAVIVDYWNRSSQRAKAFNAAFSDLDPTQQAWIRTLRDLGESHGERGS